MGAQASTEIKRCGELVEKHRAGETVEWTEFLDLAHEMEIMMLNGYRSLELLRLYRAISEANPNKELNNKQLELYQESMMSNIRTYTLPHLSDEEKKEFDEEMKANVKKFPHSTQLSIMMLEIQFEIESTHKFLELIRGSNSIEQYIQKRNETDVSQETMIQDAAAKLMIPLAGVEANMVEYWMSTC